MEDRDEKAVSASLTVKTSSLKDSVDGELIPRLIPIIVLLATQANGQTGVAGYARRASCEKRTASGHVDSLNARANVVQRKTA